MSRNACTGVVARAPAVAAECAVGLADAGWRAMLKIKHVPFQLFDVTVFPIMMTVMFTYLFGGALAGSTRPTCSTCCRASWCRPSCS
jgi:ABC-2 type transport system permease protein